LVIKLALLLINAHAVDPAAGIDGMVDVLVRDGVIAEIGECGSVELPKGIEHDVAGKLLVPGLFDMHVHFREPGQEYKEDVVSGSAAAAKGGFTDVLMMPNTKPTIDNAAQVAALKQRAQSAHVHTHISGSLTRGLAGEILSEMGEMAAAGAVAFTDDGRGVQDNGQMRRCMEYAKTYGKPVLSHCQFEDIVGSGTVNEGAASTRLGLAGWPAVGEELQIARDIALSELTGCALHIQHITTMRGLIQVIEARERGIAVTCEVTPHHLFLSEDDIDSSYDTNLKMNPPLRTKADCQALIEALINGTIDCIATDHAPHAPHEKALEFENAPNGIIGLETALGLVLTHLVAPGHLTFAQLVERMAHAPRRILGLPPVSIAVGSPADLTVIDPDVKWQVDAAEFASRSRNSPFVGATLTGRATDVFVGGYAALENCEVVAR
jgi:dihydroorotase